MSLLGYQKGEAKFAKFVLPEFRLPFLILFSIFSSSLILFSLSDLIN